MMTVANGNSYVVGFDDPITVEGSYGQEQTVEKDKVTGTSNSGQTMPVVDVPLPLKDGLSKSDFLDSPSPNSSGANDVKFQDEVVGALGEGYAEEVEETKDNPTLETRIYGQRPIRKLSIKRAWFPYYCRTQRCGDAVFEGSEKKGKLSVTFDPP